jgi:hypothetical protein
MMREPKHDDITRGAVRQSQGGQRASTRTWRFGEWLSRMIRRSCSKGMLTISRDGKLACESLSPESLCSKSRQLD